LCSPYYGDHRAQQTLYMGCPGNLVSFSPPSEYERQVSTPGPESLISSHHPPLPTPMYQSNPRIIYPSSTYLHGNPGFYYDLMQNNHHAGSQTTLVQAPTPDRVPTSLHTPTYYPTHIHTNLPTPTPVSQSTGFSLLTTYIPSNPTVHFGNTSPVTHPDFQKYSSLPGGLSSSVFQDHQSPTYDTTFDNTINIKMQSIGDPMDVGSQQGQTSIPDHVTFPPHFPIFILHFTWGVRQILIHLVWK
jgi:hypothetical protein